MATALNLNDGFRSWLEKAVRIEEGAAIATTAISPAVANSPNYLNNNNIDWSPHTVDYASFKARLRYFVQRRVKLRTLLRRSEDHCISEATLEDILTDRGNHFRHTASPCADAYIPFDDDDEDLLRQASSADEAFPDPAAESTRITTDRHAPYLTSRTCGNDCLFELGNGKGSDILHDSVATFVGLDGSSRTILT